MNSEPKPRQGSLLTFFGYATLACVSLAAYRSARSLRADVMISMPLGMIMCAAVGAALGSLFGRPKVGALCGFIALEIFVVGRVLLFHFD